MRRTLLLCLVLFVFTMTSIVKAGSVDFQRDNVPQGKYDSQNKQPDQQERDKQLRDQQEQDKQLRDKQDRDKQLRDKQDRDKQLRDKQDRDRQMRDKQERDRQMRDKQERDRQMRDKQERDRQMRDKQERDRQIRDKQERDSQMRDKQERDRQIRDKQERDRQMRDKQERDRHERDKQHRDNHRPQDSHWQDGHHNWSHDAYQYKDWRWIERPTHRELPFNWHENFAFHAANRHLEAIHDRDWQDRFPGLHPYRWRDRDGEGFWYRDHYIVDAIMFYNDSDELVSLGFMNEGIFIMLRDDDQDYENHDSFFFSWWGHNGGITIGL